ncbi:N-acetylmuramoyl-L-alanine amidase [Flammeovirga kamogawensis]|nr:N-acetylmuramoyl-L-alanine amidase [Flammeovirga kamogawensis]MBB6459962.1 N-acetylmuramoyl-L-alanine amidase [Flammeovirga kamogawensis]TRX68808.1 N-acetylmuramoyl-L-alanine amidase [Flammeovirga kamogawensis]
MTFPKHILRLLYPLLMLLILINISVVKAQSDSFKQYSFDRNVVIVIDPGHGGEDVGKPRSKKSFKHESDLNLDIAFRLGGYLEERVKNVTVKYTRKTDRTISLTDRVNYANKIKADYFISIHCNALSNRNYHGTQVHIQSEKFPTSFGLAKEIDKEFIRAGRKSRGIKDRNDRGHNLQVLQYTEMPGALIECGFMSNPTEEQYLNSGKGQTYIASALFRAIRNFENKRPRPKLDVRYPYYRVQIGATPNWKDISAKKYQNLNMAIDTLKEGKVYSLLVGREYIKKNADVLAKKIKKKGFKDAYVRTFNKPVIKESVPKPKVSTTKKEITKAANTTTDSSRMNSQNDSLHFYRIQIMSSEVEIDLTKREFTNLGFPVYLFYDKETKNSYKYQVLVGKTYSKVEAEKIKAIVRKKGFPDAFIVTVLEREKRNPEAEYIPKK